MSEKLLKYMGFIREKCQKIGMEKILIIVLCVVFLIVSGLPGKNDQKTKKSNKEVNEASTEVDYAVTIEKKLEDVLSEVEGVGKVQVMITLKSTKEAVVSKDKSLSRNNVDENDGGGGNRITNNYEESQETIYQQAGSDSVPFVVKEMEPEVEGVLVVASGGGDTSVAANIVKGVLALVNVPTHKITVLKMK